MDPRIIDILRYTLILTVVLIGSLFVHKHYKRYVTKKEIVAELQSATTDSSLYRQFEAEGAQATLLRSIALIHRGNELGLSPTELLDRVFDHGGGDGFGETPSRDYPVKEQLARNALTSAYEAAKRLEMLEPASVGDLEDGRMPIVIGGSPVILPLIDPELSPGLGKIIPNLEILPSDRAGKVRNLTAIETAAARRLADDLASAGLIEKSIAERIIKHYSTPKEETQKEGTPAEKAEKE